MLQYAHASKIDNKIIYIQLSAIISSVLTALLNTDDCYSFLWVLPIVFGLCISALFYFVKNAEKSFLLCAFCIIGTIKYIISPLLIVVSKNPVQVGPDPGENSMILAIWLMAYEVVCISILLILFYKRKNLKKTPSLTNERSVNYFAVLILLTLILVFIDYRELIPRNILNLTDLTLLSSTQSTIVAVFSKLFKLFFPIVLLKVIEASNVSIKIKLGLSFTVYFLTIGLYASTHRWDLAIITVVFISLLSTLYPEYKKTIFSVIITAGAIVFISATAFKFFGTSVYNNSSDSNTIKNVLLLISSSTQEYLSGPRNVAMAIDMKNSYGLNHEIFMFFNDLFGSTPVFSSLFDQSIRYNTLYNAYIYQYSDIISQIIPMIGIGLCSFGSIFSPIPTCFVYYIAAIFDWKIERNSEIANQYLYRYMVLFFAFSLGLDLQILANKFFVVFLPALIIVLICNKFVIVLRRK